MGAQQNILGIVGRPSAIDFPPWKCGLRASCELLRSELQCFRKIGSDERDVAPSTFNVHGKLGRESHDVIAPENTFDLWQVGFLQIGAAAGGHEVDTADLHIEIVFLGRDHEVRAVAAKFIADLVADIRSDSNHGSRDGRAQGHSDRHQQFSPRLPPE